MNSPDELYAKMQQSNTLSDCAQSGGALGAAIQGQTGLSGSYRPSILDRVRKSGYHAHEQANRLAQLAELEGLLEKNPEVARILDLIEQTHV